MGRRPVFYRRTGKRSPKRVTEISTQLQVRAAPLFNQDGGGRRDAVNLLIRPLSSGGG